MRVIIKDTKQEASVWAAAHIAAAIKAKAQKTDAPFVLGLPTGSTPLDTYAYLAQMCAEGKVSFKNVITFNMDEYVGIPEKHPESYHSFMYRNLFDKIDIPAGNIHILDGNAPDLDEECRNYEKAIEAAGGIDLFLGGVGEDGHLAFNEPFSPLNSRTRVVDLTQDTIEVNARFFGGDTSLVPKRAMSVGVGTVCSAREVLILAFGSKKARVVKEAVEGAMSHYVTLSALQAHENGTVLLDEPAAGELKVNSYRYFKAVEAAENRK